ncbi:G-protein coupled receptor family C group 6 member A-like [Tachysurus ichikawai]
MGSYFYHYLLGVTLISGISVLCVVTPSLCGAYLPGDIVFGILSSVHSKLANVYASNRPYTPCKELNLISFVQSLAIIQTIETINNSSFLPGLQLGYLMCDPCACASKALHCVEHMLAVNGSLPVLSDYTNFNSPVKAFLGERYSELSIAVAKMLSLYMIPQISCTSSAPTLSDKLRYPSFLRVIPSDIYQTQALAKLMRHFSWNWVGVVTLDDDYGNAALENFLLAAEEVKVCVEFKQVLPTIDMPEKSIKEAADCIRSSSAKIVLLILRSSLVEMLFKEMIRTNTTRTWIASDAWSMAGALMKMKDINKVGDILGFTFVTGEIPGFNDYLQNLQPSAGGQNDFIMEYKNMRFKCPPAPNSNNTLPSTCNVTDPQVMNDDFLLNVMDLTAAYSQRVAVYAVAHAINEILECNETACPGDTNFPTEKLVAILRTINFTLDNQTYSFNNNGDFDNGYDLIMWKNAGNGRKSSVVGKYLISKRDVEVYENNIQWTNSTVPWSRCSETCPPGTWKSVSDVSCCYNCTVCSEGFFSNLPDQDTCQKCPNGTTSPPNSTECQEWKVWYLKWSDPYSIVVMVGTGIGVLLLIFSFVFFVLHRDNPIIRDTFKYSCIMKFGLIVSFVGIIIFLGRPSINQCIAQQAMYAFGYTLCVSCILTKAFHTFIAYMACDPYTQHRLQRFDKPFLLIVLLNAIQGLICIFWFVFDPPGVEKIESNTALTMSHLCTQGASMIAFGAMHTYIAVLAVVCFLLAFKGIDKETDVIVFSMIIHLLAWLCFIPVFITQHELRPITQISAIMVSNYGVIFCHFAPKWFKVISEKAEHENALHITSSQSTDTVSDSAIGFSIDGSVDSFPLPNPVSATLSGPADVVKYGWENGLNIGSSVDSIKIPSTASPEQLNIADITAITNRAQITTALVWYQNPVSIRRRRTRSF